MAQRTSLIDDDVLQTRSGRTLSKWVLHLSQSPPLTPFLVKREDIPNTVDDDIRAGKAIPIPRRFDGVADSLSLVGHLPRGAMLVHHFLSMMGEPQKYRRGWVHFLLVAAETVAYDCLGRSPVVAALPDFYNREDVLDSVVHLAVEMWLAQYEAAHDLATEFSRDDFTTLMCEMQVEMRANMDGLLTFLDLCYATPPSLLCHGARSH